MCPSLNDEPQRQSGEDDYLEEAERGARRGADRDAVVAECQNAHGCDQNPDPPQVGRPAERGVERGGNHVAENQVQQWSSQRLGEGVAPCHERSRRRVEPPGDVGVHPSRRGQVAGELSNTKSDRETGDQGEDNGEGVTGHLLGTT